MKIKKIASIISSATSSITKITKATQINATNNAPLYRPTPYLKHPFLQSVYNISESPFPYKFHRETIYFSDGGHVSLDWSRK